MQRKVDPHLSTLMPGYILINPWCFSSTVENVINNNNNNLQRFLFKGEGGERIENLYKLSFRS